MVGSENFLPHVSPQDGKAESMASSLYAAMRSTKLEKDLQLIGSDVTAVMTAHSGGVIRILEERSGRSLYNGAYVYHIATSFP